MKGLKEERKRLEDVCEELSAELDALGRALAAPQQPVLAIVGGSKVSTKLEVLNALADKVEALGVRIITGVTVKGFIAENGSGAVSGNWIPQHPDGFDTG